MSAVRLVFSVVCTCGLGFAQYISETLQKSELCNSEPPSSHCDNHHRYCKTFSDKHLDLNIFYHIVIQLISVFLLVDSAHTIEADCSQLCVSLSIQLSKKCHVHSNNLSKKCHTAPKVPCVNTFDMWFQWSS